MFFNVRYSVIHIRLLNDFLLLLLNSKSISFSKWELERAARTV